MVKNMIDSETGKFGVNKSLNIMSSKKDDIIGYLIIVAIVVAIIGVNVWLRQTDCWEAFTQYRRNNTGTFSVSVILEVIVSLFMLWVLNNDS